ncbi:MAG: ABATE domain-containing protein, partial [Pyrinomonadaceae bacterium]
MRRNGQLIDFLQRDEDVLNWLGRAGFPVVAGVASHFEHGALLNCARNLRENIRLFVDKAQGRASRRCRSQRFLGRCRKPSPTGLEQTAPADNRKGEARG